jgi:hypothetical protein
MNIKETAYIAQARQANGDWMHWKVCSSLEEAERAVIDKRKELNEQQDRQTAFRIIKNEVLDSDITGEITVETCKVNHKFVRLPSHPSKNGIYYCPRCMLQELEDVTTQRDSYKKSFENTKAYLEQLETRTSKIVNIVSLFKEVADSSTAVRALAAYDRYVKEYSV